MLNLDILCKSNIKFEFFKNSKKGKNLEITKDNILFLDIIKNKINIIKDDYYFIKNLDIIKCIKFKNYFDTYIFASTEGHLDVLKYLKFIGSKININESSEMCCEYGHLEILKFLIDIGFNIKNNNCICFKIAAENGHLHILKFLKEKGYTLEDMKLWNCRCFVIASSKGFVEVLKFLKEEGYTLSDMKSDNCNAFKYAAMFGRIKVLNFLVEEGFKFNDVKNIDLYLLNKNKRKEINEFLKSISKK